MTILDFPASPVQGQTFQDWIWDGTKWTGTQPMGPPGLPGFTETTAQFVVPQVGAAVNVFVLDTYWAQPGAPVFIGGMVAMVQILDPPSEMTLIRLQDNITPDTIVNTVIPAGTTVSPAGFPGPLGPTGLAPMLNVLPSVPSASALPTTGNCAGDARVALDTGHVWMWDGIQWMDLGPITTGPTGPQGPIGPPGPPGPSGAEETGPWIPLVVGPGWNTSGNTLSCRMQLNGQQIQFRGDIIANPNFSGQTNLGNLPAGITPPSTNRFIPISATTSSPPGYCVVIFIIVSSGSLIIMPPFGAPPVMTGINLSCTVPLDTLP